MSTNIDRLWTWLVTRTEINVSETCSVAELLKTYRLVKSSGERRKVAGSLTSLLVKRQPFHLADLNYWTAAAPLLSTLNPIKLSDGDISDFFSLCNSSPVAILQAISTLLQSVRSNDPSIDFCKLKHATLHCAPHSPRTACRCTFTALHLEGRVSEVRVFLPTLLLFVPLPFSPFLLISCLSARLLHSPPSVRSLFCPSTEENGRVTDGRRPQFHTAACSAGLLQNNFNEWR